MFRGFQKSFWLSLARWSLFFKLLENKIDDQFYNLIKSLYSNSKCAVKQSKTRTDFFNYCKGVRQGCILSPLLFNIYINELATLFDNNSADPFKLPNGTKLSCLLYADDLIILSRSKSTSYPGSYLRTPSRSGKTLVGAAHVTPQNLGCFQLAF
jgi:hypothetical protein